MRGIPFNPIITQDMRPKERAVKALTAETCEFGPKRTMIKSLLHPCCDINLICDKLHQAICYSPKIKMTKGEIKETNLPNEKYRDMQDYDKKEQTILLTAPLNNINEALSNRTSTESQSSYSLNLTN
jgi:hypothetical protein